MSYLAAAVAVLAVLGLANLALTFAMARRLREHGQRLAKVPEFHSGPPRLPAGSKVPEFTAVTVTGEERSLADLAGASSLVGFFSPHCVPCQTQLPGFIELARTIPGRAAAVLAVVTSEGDDTAQFADRLDGMAAVVVEPPHGPVAKAFSTHAYPSFYLIGADGLVKASGAAVELLTSPAPAVPGTAAAPV